MTVHKSLVEIWSKVKREQLSVVVKRLGNLEAYCLVPILAITKYCLCDIRKVISFLDIGFLIGRVRIHLSCRVE